MPDITPVISLDPMPSDESVELLTRMAARADTRAADPAVQQIAELCGHLPLAIGMLAGYLRHHPARTVRGLAAQLGAARNRLALMRAENLSVGAAFDLSYEDLSADQQSFFRLLGLVPGPDIDAYAAASLCGTGLDEASGLLDELYDQHLLTEPTPGRYQLHDLVREHARSLAAVDKPSETDALHRFLDYYLYTAAAAGQHFPPRGPTRAAGPPSAATPREVPELLTLGQATAWLESELQNLHAMVGYAVEQGYLLHAAQIPAAISGFLAGRGPWDLSSALHRIALDAARNSGDARSQAIALVELSVLDWLTGAYEAAIAAASQAAAVYDNIGDLAYEAFALALMGFVQRLTGDMQAAFASYERAAELARSAGDISAEAGALSNLGEAQQIVGDFVAAASSQRQAIQLARQGGNLQLLAAALNDLGVVQQESREYEASAASQQQALEIFRDVGDRLGEAVVFNDLGVLQRETGDYRAAQGSLLQALEVFSDLGYRLGQAEALNRLGEVSCSVVAVEEARAQHTSALAIATEIGMPFEQARALEGLGHVDLQRGDHADAAAHLSRAVSIYRRIGAHAASRAEDALKQATLAIERHDS